MQTEGAAKGVGKSARAHLRSPVRRRGERKLTFRERVEGESVGGLGKGLHDLAGRLGEERLCCFCCCCHGGVWEKSRSVAISQHPHDLRFGLSSYLAGEGDDSSSVFAYEALKLIQKGVSGSHPQTSLRLELLRPPRSSVPDVLHERRETRWRYALQALRMSL